MVERDNEAAGEDGVKAIRAAQRVVELIEALGAAPDGMSLSDVARRTRLPKPTALRYLQTLEERHWVERDEPMGVYFLGSAIPAPRQSYAQLAKIAHPSLVRLASDFGENVVLGTLAHHNVRLVDVVESFQILRIANRPQDRDQLHSTAAGKAIAAQLDDEVIRRLLAAAGMPPLTDRTITEVEAYIAEVRRVRARGYAIADRENDEDSRSVAVPLNLPRAHAALALTAPAIRFSLQDARAAVKKLRAEGDYISRTVSAAQAPVP
jgi:IclR family acetate operon transcriptional repressor